MELDNNFLAREKAFREWAKTTVKNVGSIDDYIKYSLNQFIPQKLIELQEQPEDFKSVFQITDINWLENLYQRLLKNGDLHEFNKSVYARQPSAAIQKYKEFLIAQNAQSSSNTKPTINQLNQILYGPPGTGKTYHTINKALEIIDDKVPEKREEAKNRFEELRKAGQIELVTFHQSYGYEEFVEGIKAIPIGEEGNEDGTEMIYKSMPGIFKKLSKLAKDEFSKAHNTHKSTLKKYKLEAKSLNLQAEMIEDNANSFRVLKGSKIRKGQAPSFDQYTYGELKKKVLEQAKLKEQDEFYILDEDYSFQSMSAASSIVLGRQSNGITEWKEVVNDQDLFAIANEKKDIQNYVLIIDEINRAISLKSLENSSRSLSQASASVRKKR